MLTTKPTAKLIEEWKRIYDENYMKIKPNRRSGTEVNQYFCKKYLPDALTSPKFTEVVKRNILLNESNREKLPPGASPQIVTYKIDNPSVLVGIDLVTGYFHIESENISRMSEIYDDLFVYRGLDEKDIENFVIVAQYIQCNK